MEGRIELIVVPVDDVGRAKEFYVDKCGFRPTRAGLIHLGQD